MILHPGQHIGAEDVRRVIPMAETPESLRAVAALPTTPEAPLSRALDDYERLLITRALAAAGGNVAEAARRLQTDRPNLYRRMKRLEIASENESTHPV